MFKLFKKSYSEREKFLFDFLRKSSLFENLENEELVNFIPYLFLRKYQRDEVVFFTGDPSHAIYIVKSGIVGLNLDLDDGFEKIMALRSGALFGDNAVLPDTKRIYSAIVETESAELYVIPKVNIEEIMGDEPVIKAKIMTSFAETYNNYLSKLFKVNKSSVGFFDLNTVYSDSEF